MSIGVDGRALCSIVSLSFRELLQSRRQFMGSLKAIVRRLGQHGSQQWLESLGHRWHLSQHVAQSRHRFLAVRDERLHGRLLSERWLSGQQEEQRRTKAVDVRASVGLAGIHRLFGRDVGDRSEDRFAGQPIVSTVRC